MKKIILYSVWISGLIFAVISAAQAKAMPLFDHSGIQKGNVEETCYHNPCSVGKDISYKVLSKTAKETKIELTILGGSRAWESKKIDWNKKPHQLYITCSVQKPTVQVDQQKTIVPFNSEMGIPGVLTVDAEIYLHVCHNAGYEDMDSIIQRFGYHVQED